MQIVQLKELSGEFEIRVNKAKNICIIPHVNADGDAIGSAVGLYEIIKNINSNVRVFSPGDFPSFLKWLPGADDIDIYKTKKKNFPEDADLLICVDFNEPGRAGELKDFLINTNAFKILIDHHPNPADFADLIISDTSYSSTAELVYRLINITSYNEYINLDFATNIYAGIMTDTGSFNFGSSNPETFRAVAELLELGVNKDMVFSKIYDEFSFNRMRFLGHALLNNMTYLPEYNTAYIAISAKDRKDFKEQIGDTENFVNFPLSISGCKFAAIFIEREKFIKISFRSKGDFSAGEFCRKHFNGGGHKNASGGESHKSLEETIKDFTELLKRYSEELKN